MNETLETKLKYIPAFPGVYQFLDINGKVIYVGKAKNIRNRVRNYFQTSVTAPKTIALVKRVNDIEIIVTDNEIEALVLENNLIKTFKPRYNVNLKDDKSYPYIQVTSEPFPRIFPTRQIIKDGSKYFGPYTDVRSMKSSLRMINKIFKIRSCNYLINDESIEKKKIKVCLDYHIKKCDGPCEGLVSEKDYNEMVDEVVKLLGGKTDLLIKELTQKMYEQVDNLAFEKAAELRDKIKQLEVIASKQKIVTNDFVNRDVIAVAHEGKDAACSLFNIRIGKLVGKKELKLSVDENDEPSEIYSSVLKYYYNEMVEVPEEIVIESSPADIETLTEWLKIKSTKKFRFIFPKKSSSIKSLLHMCKENAILQLKDIQLQKMKKEGNLPYTLTALKRDLRLPLLPKHIECFDISTLQGTDTVASMVVFVDGQPKKSLYRKFIIKNVIGPDDFASMEEVIERRYQKLINEKHTLPDLIMVDGGKGQLSAAVSVLLKFGFKEFQIIGLAKRLEEIFFPGIGEALTIPKTSSSLKLLQKIRDEAHRFAITFHRERRSKRTIKTELTEIKGIGNTTATLLLKKFGSVKNIKEIPLEEIAEIIGTKKAVIVKDFFNYSEK